jgi:repressor LexA
MVQDRSTRKQQELLQFIDGFIKGNGYGPSYREVMRALGYKSVSTVAIHIDGLIARGYLRKRDRSARSIEVITLRDERSSAPSRVESKNEIAWLEKEITDRLAQDTVPAEEVDTLVAAAELLGSLRVDEFRQKQAELSL